MLLIFNPIIKKKQTPCLENVVLNTLESVFKTSLFGLVSSRVIGRRMLRTEIDKKLILIFDGNLAVSFRLESTRQRGFFSRTKITLARTDCNELLGLSRHSKSPFHFSSSTTFSLLNRFAFTMVTGSFDKSSSVISRISFLKKMRLTINGLEKFLFNVF